MTPLLDVRGLPPCEPFDRIMAALDVLPAGAVQEVLIHREPVPLYDWLRENGFAWKGGPEPAAEGGTQYRFFIRQA